jgi:predicted enzyme related to lactoylglutathione lyase
MAFTRINFQPIQVTDTARARDFYRDKLGFTVDTDVPYGGDRWVFMRVGDSPTMIQFDRREAIAPSPTPVLILVTDDVDAECATLRARGVEIIHDADDAPWAPGTRWAMLKDSEGNLVLIQTVRA